MDLDTLLMQAALASDHVDAGQRLMDGSKFERGDVLARIAQLVGEDDLAIECAHRYLSADPDRRRVPAEMTLKGELRVSRAIPLAERDVRWLSWSCYRELAALDAELRGEVYQLARDEGVHTVSGIRLLIARVKGAPESAPVIDVTTRSVGEAVRIELRRYYGGRYAAEDIDEFCDQYERIRGEVEAAHHRVRLGGVGGRKIA